MLIMSTHLKNNKSISKYVLGIGYPEYIQVSPSFINYFGQRAMNSGLRKGYRASPGTGTCESDYLFAQCGYSCGTIVDNCGATFRPVPWYSKESSSCKCRCTRVWF